MARIIEVKNGILFVDGYRMGELLDAMPDGWKVTEGATTAPVGYKWITNGKSFFGGERKSALISEENLREQKLNLTEQQNEQLRELRATAALLAIKVDLLRKEYEQAQEREKAVHQAVIMAQPFYYAEDFCEHKQGERITDADKIGAASDEQLAEFCAIKTAKYAEIYGLNYPVNYCPVFVEYRKPLLEAKRELRKTAAEFMRICGKNEIADALEKAINGYIRAELLERLDGIVREYIAA